ncbi:hypothetical protein Lal_00002611, partial [Lupinus albus]
NEIIYNGPRIEENNIPRRKTKRPFDVSIWKGRNHYIHVEPISTKSEHTMSLRSQIGEIRGKH